MDTLSKSLKSKRIRLIIKQRRILKNYLEMIYINIIMFLDHINNKYINILLKKEIFIWFNYHLIIK